MPQSMVHSQTGPVECRSVGIGYATDRQIDSLLNGRKSTVLLFEPQADLATGQPLFANLFPLSLVVRLNSLLLPAELGAGWKFPVNGPAGQPRDSEYPAQAISIRPMLCRRGSPRRAIAICAHYLLTARWPLCAKRRDRPDKHPWVAKLLGRMSAKRRRSRSPIRPRRIAWANMVHGGVYEAGYRAPKYRAQACAVAG